MQKFALILAFCLLLTGIAGCAEPKAPAQVQPTGDSTGQTQNQTLPEDTTQAPGQDTTGVPDDTTQTTQEPVPAGPQPMDLVGTWTRTHTEVEGDRNENTKATLTIAGDSEDSLTVTYKDTEFPDDNFTDKALTVAEGELYTDCGNDAWFARVDTTGKYSYALTLQEDGTVVLECSFEIDGAPMVAHQWFAKSE